MTHYTEQQLEPHFADPSEYEYNPRVFELVKSAVVETVDRHRYDESRHDDEQYRKLIYASAEPRLFGRLHAQDIDGYGYDQLRSWLENTVMAVTNPWEKTHETSQYIVWERERNEYRSVELKLVGGGAWKVTLADEKGILESYEGASKYDMLYKANEIMANRR